MIAHGLPFLEDATLADQNQQVILQSSRQLPEAQHHRFGVGINQHCLGCGVPEDEVGVPHDLGSRSCQDLYQFLRYASQTLFEALDVTTVLLVDSSGHSVEVIPERLEAKRIAVLEGFELSPFPAEGVNEEL